MRNYRLTRTEFQKILDFKRDMHMHPELSFREGGQPLSACAAFLADRSPFFHFV